MINVKYRKSSEVLAFATIQIDLEGIMPSEMRKTYIVWFHSYVKSKEKRKKTQNTKKQNWTTNTENKLLVVVVGVRGVKWAK